MLPHFIVVGNLRSGTTWVDNCLREHPQVFLPRHVKGTHFFSHRFHKGTGWYESHFEDWRGEEAVGEVSPLCLGSPCAARNIHDVIPHARIVACLRDPMTSIWSHYLRDLMQGHTRRSFRAEVEENSELRGYHLHFKNLKRYLELFPAEQIKILFQEDFPSRPHAVLEELFAFLGVRADFRPSVASRRVNEARFIRYPVLAKAVSAIRWGLRDRKMYKAVNLVKALGLVDLLFGMGAPRGVTYSPEDRILVRELFQEDVSQLSGLTGRDLGHWLSVD
jgi:hypothetical protein